jgi:small subunit ribosomal protein S3Ae
MAIGKNKRLSKGKKGGKKKIIDPLSRKEWFDFKAPPPFESLSFGKTLITKTQGTRIATERIKGRVVEVSLADLKSQSEQNDWRKIKLWIEDVDGRNCRTSFYGMDVTRDKLCQYIRKWQTLIEANCEVKTQDGYVLRMFCIAFTKRDNRQIRKTSYAQGSQVKMIRKKMVDVLTKEAAASTLTSLVQTLITDSLGEAIKKECKFIFPLNNVLVRKVKLVKKPKFDVGKLTEMYSVQKPAAGGEKVEGAAAEGGEDESKNLLNK